MRVRCVLPLVVLRMTPGRTSTTLTAGNWNRRLSRDCTEAPSWAGSLSSVASARSSCTTTTCARSDVSSVTVNTAPPPRRNASPDSCTACSMSCG